ncbi:MAG: hypothetical protein FJ291_07525 [Planctomycetes bacterium]|nr:hypothetical protein [Planctomycetota bacterium]
MKAILCCVAVLAWLLMAAGCSPARPMMATPEYQERPPIVGSLFKADQSAMSEEAVARVLGSKVVLPKKARVALMRFPDRLDPARKFHWGLYYFREETYLKSQQAYMDTLREELAASGRVQEAVALPALMTPTDAGLPVLREAAVRLQADLLLVYRHTSDVYYEYVFLGRDRAKGYCTCEAVLLDVIDFCGSNAKPGCNRWAPLVAREAGDRTVAQGDRREPWEMAPAFMSP